ncbi:MULTISPECIES: alpha/beta hydrolase [Microvirgula]|uniref:Phospholipase n=1 Tax=Microvirgula aerodenitrificans TaxID=57480 RepID=A0A2S0PB79_9NEIS|nr:MULTISPECIES: phospholipase [Microvirgula]AVY94595.1 phospholipase [Microvirgula aerodenitrificans]RAS18964.1 phospholipase/carboxylesterase [Microvirgula sp. AG722]
MNIRPDSGFGPLQQDPGSGLHYRLREQGRPGPVSARLLLLHGVGGNETNLAMLAAAIDPRVQVVLVRAPLALGPEQFAWFQVRFGAGGPVIDPVQAERSRQQLLTLVRGLQTQDGGTPARTVVAGFSQGGILSASVGLSAPLDVAGFAVLSGRILPELEPYLAPRTELAGSNGFIAHGRFDDKLPVAWAERADQWLDALGVPHRTQLYPIGHELSLTVVDDFKHWLAEPLSLI